MFPLTRPRRLRSSAPVRRLVRESRLSASDLILPLFVTHGTNVRRAIASMPGHFQLSLDQLSTEAGRAGRAGLPAVLLFGIPKRKDAVGSEAYAANGITQQAVRTLKKKFPSLVVMTDLCFCEYTSHGHCGVVRRTRNGAWEVDNDATLKLIRKIALAQAKAGADFVAPSGMMDGAVLAIRQELDAHGHKNTGILAYSAKYASTFYGPFREAAECKPAFGDRRSYQMDPANSDEALREIRQDIAEGADMVMVKPALAYLDVISRIKHEAKVPVVAYNVSGEFAMVKAAERLGWLDPRAAFPAGLEILTAIKRAGADLIITYHALELAPLLNERRT